MKREITDSLAEAAYNARLEALKTGIYPKSAFTIPSSSQCYQWDEVQLYSGLKDVYRKEGEAVAGAFIQFIIQHSTPEAQEAFSRVIHEVRDHLFTDVDLALMEGGERQDG